MDLLSPTSTLYRVYHSCGAGTARGPAFKSLADAKRYVLEQRTPGSFAIRKPDGTWHRWQPSNSVVYNVHAGPRLASGTFVDNGPYSETDDIRRLSSPLGFPPGVPSGKARQ